MGISTGKLCLVVTLALAASLLTGGCNFFGKQADPPAPPAGELADGTSFVGSWSISTSSLAANGIPDFADTTTITLDATGTVRLETRDARVGGMTCVGSGQYRLMSGTDVLIYIQAVLPTDCLMPAQLHLTKIKVQSTYLSYTDPGSGGVFHLYNDHSQTLAPVGVWVFGGAGGIDYLFFDHHGYFLVQTTIDNEQYMLEGKYTIASDGQLTLSYFSGSDPSQIAGSTVFSGYVTNGLALDLYQSTSGGDVVFSGVLY